MSYAGMHHVLTVVRLTMAVWACIVYTGSCCKAPPQSLWQSTDVSKGLNPNLVALQGLPSLLGLHQCVVYS